VPVSSVRYDLLFGDVDLNRRQGAPLDDRQRLDGGKITTHGPIEVSLTVVVVFQGTIQDVTHPDIVLAECDRQPQRLEQRRKGRPGQSGGILFEFVGHPEFKRPTLLPFVFIEGVRRDLDDRHLVDLALESLDQILSIRFSRWTTA
jgi:hypothetical protein